MNSSHNIDAIAAALIEQSMLEAALNRFHNEEEGLIFQFQSTKEVMVQSIQANPFGFLFMLENREAKRVLLKSEEFDLPEVSACSLQPGDPDIISCEACQ
jgi:hypothetical protein